VNGASGKPTYATIVGRVIRLRRELRGIPLEAMALKLGYKSSSGWSRIETGDSAITMDRLREAAIVLNTTPGYIIQDADDLAKELL
jgi:transcriptional regulator with XRE-family HTH domain